MAAYSFSAPQKQPAPKTMVSRCEVERSSSDKENCEKTSARIVTSKVFTGTNPISNCAICRAIKQPILNYYF